MTYTSVKLLFCSIVGETTYHVSSYEGKVYRISSQPYGHSLYSEEFRFTLKHPLGNPNEVAHVIYSRESRGHSFIESNLDLSNQGNFPIDVVTLSDEHDERHKTKVYSIKRHRYGTMLSLDDHKNVDCCSKDVIFSFSAYNVSRTGKRKKKEKKAFSLGLLFLPVTDRAWENSRYFAMSPLVSPQKWRLRNESRSSVLMTCHYPDLGCASDWLK